MRIAKLIGLLVLLLTVPAASAGAVCVSEFSNGLGPASGVGAIAAGPDGNVWFTDTRAKEVDHAPPYTTAANIGQITTSGKVTEFSTPTASDEALRAITAGPNGNMWFTATLTDSDDSLIGRITPSGTVTEFSAGISPGASDLAIAAGPDGNLWFTEFFGHRIGRITPTGAVTEFSAGISPNEGLSSIAAGPDGNMWFTEDGLYVNGIRAPDRIGRITPGGTVTEFAAGSTTYESLGSIVSGPDGDVWFLDEVNNLIERITPDGTVTAFASGMAVDSGSVDSLAAGPDGNLWFTAFRDAGAVVIGRITPTGTVTDFSTGLPPDSPLGAIAAGPDGNLWSASGDGIARITTSGSCRAAVASRHALVSRAGLTQLKLSCAGDRLGCIGTLKLLRRGVEIADASYSVGIGRTAKVGLRLSAHGRKLLGNARHHRLSVAATALGARRTVTLTLA